MKPPLTLVSLDGRVPWGSVHERLLRLGYPVEVAGDEEAHQKAGSAHRIAICLFDEYSVTESRKTTLAMLARFAGCPRMGLFMGERPTWDRDIVSHCNEFSVWPCPEDELDVRLQRLGSCAAPRGETRLPPRQDLIHLNLIGESPSFLDALARIKRFTRCSAPVLIEGETGTGKELAARAVHYLSDRREQPFIPVNCGALPDSLLENELFGHAKGAFTDAGSSQPGLIAQAEKGTLFLDELECLTQKAQVAVLRFLQDMEYRPLGSGHVVQADVRIIVATNVPLPELEQSRDFRRDLLYRLNVMPVRLPPLRERAEDVVLLAEHFLAGLRRRYGQPEKYLDPRCPRWMRGHDWPGNIRELENLIHRQFLLADDAVVCVAPPGEAHSPYDPVSPTTLPSSFNEAKARAIECFERDYLTRLLRQSGGNVSLAARRAGKERRAFGKLLKKYTIDKTLFR